MALAVCLLFDSRGDAALRQIWERLEAEGVRSLRTHTHGHHHPHLSYAVLRSWDLETVRTTLNGLDGEPFSLTFHGLVAFPRGRAAIIPAVGADVMRRQERVATLLADAGAELHRHYEPGRWIPHCSLSPRANGSSLAIVAKAVTDVLPLTVQADRAALVDSSTGELWTLPGIP